MIKVNSLPKHWAVKKLGEVCHTTSGGTPNRGNPKYYAGNIPWVKSGELDKGLITETEEKISEEGLKSSSAKLFPKGTLLIALYGATIGKLAFLGVEAATNQAICGIFENEKVNSKFLYYFLFWKKASLVKQSFGGAQPNISQTILRSLDLPFPPLPEQAAIVAKIEELLSDLENGRQQLLTAQQQLKVYRQSLLKWAFEGKLTKEWRRSRVRVPSESPTTKVQVGSGFEPKKSSVPKVGIETNGKNVPEVRFELGQLPEGWRWVKLGEVTKKKTAKALPADYPDAKFIGMDCIEPNTLKPTFTYKFSEFKSAGNYFEAGQVLYGRMRPYLNKVYKAEYDGTCSGEFIILQCERNFNPDLLKYILHSQGFVSFANHMTSGDRPRISYEEISDYPIALASLEEQEAIVEELEAKLTVCDKIEETITTSLQQAETLRQSILKRAFEGRLI
jgi:type I restriction enzyme S subunit